jgi:hypothetical protein
VIRVSAPEQHPVDHIMSAPISDKDKIAAAMPPSCSA